MTEENKNQITNQTDKTAEPAPMGDAEILDAILSKDTKDKAEDAVEAKPEPTGKDKEPAGEPEGEKGSKPLYNREAIQAKRQFALLSKQNRELTERLAQIEKTAGTTAAEAQRLELARKRLADPSTSYDDRARILHDLAGMDVVQSLADSFVQTGGERKPPAADKPEHPELEQLKKEMAEIRAATAAKEAELLKARKTEVYHSELSRASKFLEDNSTEYPLLSSIGTGAEIVVRAVSAMDEASEFIGLSDPEIRALVAEKICELEANTEKTIERQLKALAKQDKFKQIMERIASEDNGNGKDKSDKASKTPKKQTKTTLTSDMRAAPKDAFDYANASKEEIEAYALAALEEG